jgi:hypothetical protein
MSIATAMDNTNSPKTACECQKFSIEIWTGEVPEGADPGQYVEYIEIGCQQTTTRTFAPGHDAKLKSLLIQAGTSGHAVRCDEGGVNHIGSAMAQAARYGFEHQVAAGIKKAQAKNAERHAKKTAKLLAQIDRQAAKAAAKREKAGKTEPKQNRQVSQLVAPVQIKVGRWTYEAIINPADNSAEYTSANGEVKTADEGKYKLVA